MQEVKSESPTELKLQSMNKIKQSSILDNQTPPQDHDSQILKTNKENFSSEIPPNAVDEFYDKSKESLMLFK